MEDLIKFAESFLGVVEGSERHHEIIDGYNNNIRPLPRGYHVTYWDAWCATFVSFVLWMCGYRDFPFECGCQEMFDKARRQGIDITEPKIGTVILYDWQGDGHLDHVGIITGYDGYNMEVIEGNNNNAVRYRYITRDYGCIKGYIDTGYTPQVETPIQETPSIPVQEQTALHTQPIAEIAQEVILGKWGNGEERRVKLAAAGYDYAVVQKEVNAILNGTAVQETQPEKPSVDLDAIAHDVIMGAYGNGAERREKLEAAGYDYDEVQARVNAILWS